MGGRNVRRRVDGDGGICGREVNGQEHGEVTGSGGI